MANKSKKWLDKNLKERQGHFDKKKGFLLNNSFSDFARTRGSWQNILLTPKKEVIEKILLCSKPHFPFKPNFKKRPHGKSSNSSNQIKKFVSSIWWKDLFSLSICVGIGRYEVYFQKLVSRWCKKLAIKNSKSKTIFHWALNTGSSTESASIFQVILSFMTANSKSKIAINSRSKTLNLKRFLTVQLYYGGHRKQRGRGIYFFLFYDR